MPGLENTNHAQSLSEVPAPDVYQRPSELARLTSASTQPWRHDSALMGSRSFALLIALAVQLLLISMFSQRRERSLINTKSMTLIEIAKQPDAPVEIVGGFTEPVPLPARIPQPSTPSTTPEPLASAAPSNSLRELNTQAIAARAVAKIIEEESRRHLNGRKPVTITAPPVPSMFEQPRHSLGDVEHDPASDITTVWHSDNCFTRIVPKAVAGSSLPNYRQCMFAIGKREPRGDLFEHLREPKPLPEAKPGVPIESAYSERRSRAHTSSRSGT